MAVVASIVLFLAATVPPPLNGPSSRPAPTSFPNEDALLHYAQGRLLEERGETRDAMSEYYRALLLDRDGTGVARRLSELAARQGRATARSSSPTGRSPSTREIHAASGSRDRRCSTWVGPASRSTT